jgi:hypothetical protein
MSAIDRLFGTLARTAHPRLLVLAAVGVAAVVLGGVLVLATSGPAGGPGTLGIRLAIVGALLFLLGASGYVAFAVFERGFE